MKPFNIAVPPLMGPEEISEKKNNAWMEIPSQEIKLERVTKQASGRLSNKMRFLRN